MISPIIGLTIAALVLFIIFYKDYEIGKMVDDVDAHNAKVDAELNQQPVDISKMTKVELEEYARGFGVELDRRKTKAHMIADFEKHLNK